MRVVFLQDVINVAEAGEVREVKRGFAKNYLLPRKLAAPAVAQELARVAALKRVAAVGRQEQQEGLDALGLRVQGAVVTLLQRAGPTGRLYGSVTNAAIAEALSQRVSHVIDRRTIALGEAIRQTGEYPVKVRLGPEHVYDVTVVVTTEELLQQREQARQAAATAAALASKAMTDDESAETAVEGSGPEDEGVAPQ
ncbi:MAG: 50S ribosomal protein L9 [Dehalococcoidia bacterium]|nr:50S ribosomal protein L9 [Dehalococcoidia bacterium]